MSKIKILFVVPSLRLCNGVASFVMNYFRAIDKSKFQIDFLISSNTEYSVYFDEIKKYDSKIYCMNKINLKNGVKGIKNFFKEHGKDYDIIHCNVLNSGLFYLYYAKKYGIKTRILHSHVTKTSDVKFKEIINNCILKLSIRNATDFCACTEDAGKAIFKNRQFHIIYNALDLNRFAYNDNARSKLRKKYNISDDDVVIGNIGRFCNQKNQLRLLEVYNKFKIKNKYTKLFLIGNDGPLKDKINNFVEENNLKNDIIIAMSQSNIEDYYQMFDMFILPSVYEGLGIVLIVAQKSGLPCIVSNYVPFEANVTDYYYSVNLEDDDNVWINKIENVIKKDLKYLDRKNVKFSNNNYDISEAVKKLEEYYVFLYKRSK